MATTATLIGPIGARQINSNLYVGQSDLTTIQKAVNVAVAAGTIFTVHVPAEYAGSDTIAAVTGGSASVYILDERGGQRQMWLWFGGAYIQEAFLIIAIATSQLNSTLYVGPLGRYPTIQSAITTAAGFANPVAIIAITPYYTGSEVIGSLTGGKASIYLSDTRTASPQNYVWNGSNYVPATFAPLGSAQFPGGITGPLAIAGNLTATGTVQGASIAATGAITGASIAATGAVQGASITATGAITGASAAITGTITAAEVQATDAQFATCEVANSPVRTFANTADTPGGMQWPPIGIGVSTGTAWGASIDPTTLQGKLTLTTTGTSGAATLTGNALNVPQYTAPAQVYPPPGIGVSTGSAWGTSIDPTTLAYLATDNVFAGNIFFTKNNSGTTIIAPGSQGLIIGWNLSGVTGETDFINTKAGGLGGFNWYNVAAGSNVTGANVPLMSLSTTGLLTLSGSVRIGPRTPLSVWQSGTPNINSDNLSLVINGGNGSTGGIFLNYDQGGAGVRFCNGAAVTVATVDVSGNATFNGTLKGAGGVTTTGFAPTSPGSLSLSASGNIGYLDSLGTGTANAASLYLRVLNSTTSIVHNSIILDPNGNCAVLGTLTAGTKNFRITHPLDDTKNLTHSCLEGPEVGVYYRGEAVIVDGYAVVTLPDYFEALTFPEDRSVQLTQVWEDAPVFARYAASRVVDGKFTIHATENVTIAWEVKAVRRLEVERLQVETKKPIEPEVVWNDSTNTDRSGTPEDGKPKSKKVRA